MKLTRTVPESPERLREILLMIFDGRPFLAFAGVSVATSSLDVVWRSSSRADGYRNVYVPLKRDSLGTAQRLVEHLLSQMALGLPPSQPAAEELFALVDRHGTGAGEVDRRDYDDMAPANALAGEPRGEQQAAGTGGEEAAKPRLRDFDEMT